MLFKIPVIVTVEATDDFHKDKQLNEFLRTSYREFAASHNVLDYEVLDHLTKEK